MKPISETAETTIVQGVMRGHDFDGSLFDRLAVIVYDEAVAYIDGDVPVEIKITRLPR